jgi:hypothetical protein
MKSFAENEAASVYTPPEHLPFSGEAWERSNLTHMFRMQRSGKDDGERTPPIQQLLDAHVQLSTVAESDAALPPSDASVASPLAKFTSQASDPIRGLATVNLATGNAHSAFWPPPVHAIQLGQAFVPPYAIPSTPLTAASEARFTNQVTDTIHGLTAVVPTTGSVIHALHPETGHAIHHCQVSAHTASVPPPQPVAVHASNARFTTSQVADPINRLTAAVPTTGGVIHALQPNPGHAIHHGQASAQPIFVPLPPNFSRYC